MSNLLPPNATPQEHALDDATARIGAVPTPIRELWNPDTCPADLLPWLAWALSLDSWQPYWPEAVKRQRIRSAVEIARRKGTPWAVKRALALSGIEAELAEWWHQAPAGAPFTFTVDIAAGQPAAREPAAFEAAQRHVDEWKPVSRHASYRIAAAALAASAIAACGTAHMQWQGAGELLAQPLRGASAYASAAAGHGFLLMAGSGTLQ